MSSPARRFVLLGGPLLCLCGLSRAQVIGGTEDLAYRYEGTKAGDGAGWAIAGFPDADGDGIGEVLVGAPFATVGPFAQAGSVYLLSGATGSLLHQFDGGFLGDHFGTSVACVGDTDGDGTRDILVGAPLTEYGGVNAGSVYLFSGATGALLHRIDGTGPSALFGSALIGAGDLDGDGREDLLVGAYADDYLGRQDSGAVYAFSGATGALLYVVGGKAPGDNFGASIAPMDDLDGDGFPEFAVGAPLGDTVTSSEGLVSWYSGHTGVGILTLAGAAGGEEFGFALAAVSDRNGDGLRDLAIGIPGRTGPAGTVVGAVQVIDTTDILTSFLAYGQTAGERFGASISELGDVDGDGVRELFIGSPEAGGAALRGAASIFSGGSEQELYRFTGESDHAQLGLSVASTAAAGGGRALAGAFSESPGGRPRAGAAYVYYFNPILSASATQVSISKGLGVDYDIDFPDRDAGAPYGVLLSMSGTGPTVLGGLAVPLGLDRLLLASLRGRTPVYAVGFQGVLDARGRATAHIVLPPSSTLSPGAPTAAFGGSPVQLQVAVINGNLDVSSVPVPLVFRP